MNLQGLTDLFFNSEVALKYLPDLMRGLWVTVSLSVVVVASGLSLGLALALLRLVSHRYVIALMRLWVDCLRAVPPLAVVLLIYFGLPGLGFKLSAYWVLWLTLTAILAAFSEEIFWAGISSIAKGQWEAARSTGLTTSKTLSYVILPQAFKICVPPLTNRSIAITKNTALGTAIGMPELLNEAQTALSFSGNATPLMIAALGYLIIFMPVMALAGRLGKAHGLGGASMNGFMEQFFNADVVVQAFPFLLKGLLITLGLTALLAPLGIVMGLYLALVSNPRSSVLRFFVRGWVNVFRAMPPLVLIILTFSGLPFLGIRLPAIVCVIIALLLNNSAYFCEIFRAGLGSVSPGQLEAARSTGLTTFAAMRYVVLPQAVRNVLPDLASNTIEVMKSTSLAAIIGVGELLYVAGNARSVTYNTTPLMVAAMMYLVILLPCVRLAERIERKALH